MVDYVIANKTGLELTSHFDILDPTLEWSDHAALSLHLMFPVQTSLINLLTHHKILSRPSTIMNHHDVSSNPLDALQIKILSDISTPRAKLICLYGHLTPSQKVIEVYTDGSCHGNSTKDARAGLGIFWGTNAPNNLATCVPGKQTNNCSKIYAILKAIQLAPKNLSLKIFTDSVYAIKSLAEWAPNSADKAWKIENRDIIHGCVKLIKFCEGTVSLMQVKGHSGNQHNDAADLLACEGSSLPPVGKYIEMGLPESTDTTIVDDLHSHINSVVPKVTATYLPSLASGPPLANISKVSRLETVDNSSLPSHWGHEKVRDTKALF